MTLHHRYEIANMRSAYESDQSNAHTNSLEPQNDRDMRKHRSQTPPILSSSSVARRAPLVQYITEQGRHEAAPQYFPDRPLEESPRSSVETYASTAESEEDLLEHFPDYEVPEFTAQPYQSEAIAATPADFSELFPSRRRLAIRHDDSTIDGNMNLRVDTEVSIQGQRTDMTLFHLRMHDLKTREFSLRRYCRDSGREVCHSTRKQRRSIKRPGIHRSLSNALHSIRPKFEHRSSTDPKLTSLTRHDSGYGSMHSVDFTDDDRPRSAGQAAKEQDQLSTDTVHLEFSNYAQVDVKRTGNRNKRYEFEYWGVHYAWKRMLLKAGSAIECSFQLTKAGSDKVLAYIMPIVLTPRQTEEERIKGGWISPSSMWIADESVVRSQKDLADVVVAAGLISLVDESIRARFHSKTEKQLMIPVMKASMESERLGPNRLINEMFNRVHVGNSRSRPSSSGK